MPRKVRDSSLETRAARSRLPVRHKPYFRLIEPGLHLGYRKLTSGPGTWLARRYTGEGKYVVENLRTADGALILADDYEDSDGKRILTFAEAQRQARGPRSPAGEYTVANAIRDYLAFLRNDHRSKHSVNDAEKRAESSILPRLGSVKAGALTAKRIRGWHHELVGVDAGGDDERRAKRASANRVLTILKAALNRAWREGEVSNDEAWRRVSPFKGVEKARVRYLTIAEARRLLNACEPDFRRLVTAALLTGARYGQIISLHNADYNPDAATLRLSTRKGDGSPRVYYVHLSDEARQFFDAACTGRSGTDLIFKRADGNPWGASHQIRLIEEASRRAKIEPPANFHVTRHTFASHAVMSGAPLLVVAQALGHTDTRMVEKHYGHLSPSFSAAAIRQHAPRFGFKPDKKIVALG